MVFLFLSELQLILKIDIACICKTSARAKTSILLTDLCRGRGRPDNHKQQHFGNEQESWNPLKILRLFNLASTNQNGCPLPDKRPAKKHCLQDPWAQAGFL